MCALQIMDIATFYRGNMPAFFTMRYAYAFSIFIKAIFNVHLAVMYYYYYFLFVYPFSEYQAL